MPDTDTHDDTAASSRGATTPLSTRDRVRRTALVLAVLACLVGLGWGASHTREVDDNGDPIAEDADPGDVAITGDDDLIAQLPPVPSGDGPSEAEIVEQTFPADGAEILQQQQIGIDLGDLYRASAFYLQGTLLPEEELTRRDELNQVFFQPGADFTFEALPPGPVCARVDVVRTTAPGEVLRSVEWCFEVT